MSGPIYTFASEGETQEVITADEAEALLGASDSRAEEVGSDRHRRDAPGPVYRIEAVRGRFRIAHTESEARRGDIIRANQSARLIPHGKPIFASVDAMPRSGEAELLVRISDFDLFPDPVASMFAASDENDKDVPAASDGQDSASWSGNFDTEAFAAMSRDGSTADGENYYLLDVPAGANEVTIHGVMDETSESAWSSGDELDMWIEFVGHSERDGSEVITRRSGSNSAEYRITSDERQGFVTTSVPAVDQVRVGVNWTIDPNVIGSRPFSYHAVVK